MMTYNTTDNDITVGGLDVNVLTGIKESRLYQLSAGNSLSGLYLINRKV